MNRLRRWWLHRHGSRDPYDWAVHHPELMRGGHVRLIAATATPKRERRTTLATDDSAGGDSAGDELSLSADRDDRRRNENPHYCRCGALHDGRDYWLRVDHGGPDHHGGTTTTANNPGTHDDRGTTTAGATTATHDDQPASAPGAELERW